MFVLLSPQELKLSKNIYVLPWAKRREDLCTLSVETLEMDL